jgi:DNA-binding NarL/FixJ family response regulator
VLTRSADGRGGPQATIGQADKGQVAHDSATAPPTANGPLLTLESASNVEAESRGPRVVLVDDHDVFRRGLAKLLVEQEIDVVGEAAQAEMGLALVARLAPDVVVMDLNLPGMSGLEAIERLAVDSPSSRVLVLTISVNDQSVTRAIVSGACGYLLKDASIADIVAGIRAASAGESVISPKIAIKLLHEVRSPTRKSDIGGELSAREIEVLRLVAEGRDNSEIARTLFISPQTVKNHISNILAKLQMENRIQAAVYAVRRGLV